MPELAKRVLLVDDDLAVRTSLKFALELEGLTVRVYDSGAALLADPELAQSACVVVDYNMPGMNGIELVEQLEERVFRTLLATLIEGVHLLRLR